MGTPNQKSIRQLEKELESIEEQLQESNRRWGPRADQKGDAKYSAREFLATVAVVEDARHRRDQLTENLIQRGPQILAQHRKPHPAAITPVRSGLSTHCQDLLPDASAIADFEALIKVFEADPEWCALRDEVVALWERRASLVAELETKRMEAHRLTAEARLAEEAHVADAVQKAKASLPAKVQGMFTKVKELTGG